MASTQIVEYRCGTRYNLDTPAQLKAPDGTPEDVRIRDASLSGAFVETRSTFPLFTLISLRQVSRPCQWLDACVVRAEHQGIAVKWLDPGLRPIASLLPPDSPTKRRSLLESRWS